MAKANGHYQTFCASETEAILPIPTWIEPGLPRAVGDNRTSRIIEVDGAILPDGRILDLVHSPGSTDELAWLVWYDGEFTISNRVEFDGRVYVPPQVPIGFASAVRLPVGVGPCFSAHDLITKIESRASCFLDLGEDEKFLLAAFVLASTLADRLQVKPILAICGPPGSGKTTMLRFLHCTARRALHAGEISRASLYKLADLFSPTLLIDEADFGDDKASRDLMRLLRTGTGRGADTYVNGRRFRTSCPKVISSRVPLHDAALASRTIHITMLPSQKPLQVLDVDAEQSLAEELQGELERFRLEHYHEIHVPRHFDDSGLTPRMRDMARALAAPFLGDPALLNRLMECLKDQDEITQMDRAGEPEWAVTATLYRMCHYPEHRLFIGSLADEVARTQGEMGETYTLSPRMVGGIVRKSLGVETKKIGKGFYIELTSARRRQIHQLARNMGLTRADMLEPRTVETGCGGPPCRLCAEYGLYIQPDGTELRPFELPKPARRREPIFGPD